MLRGISFLPGVLKKTMHYNHPSNFRIPLFAKDTAYYFDQKKFFSKALCTGMEYNCTKKKKHSTEVQDSIHISYRETAA